MKWTNPIKEKLKRGESVAGCWLICPSLHTAEMISSVGFDWAMIDLEHGPISIERCSEMAMAFRGSETVPLVRVPMNRPEYFKQVLDAGAWGALVPMVNTAEEAREAVAASHYPPFGMRGRAKSRNVISAGVSSEDYLRDARDAVLVAVQIETPEAVENINEIAQVEGVDLVFIGPNDLSATTGVEKGSGQLETMIDSVLRASLRRGRPAGIYCSDAAEANKRLEQGFQFVGCASEMGFLEQGAKQAVAELWGRYDVSRSRYPDSTAPQGFRSFASRYSENSD